MRLITKLNIELFYDPAVSLLDIFQKKMKSGCQRGIQTTKFTAAVFIIAKKWKQPM
jgi:hypothetical protein